jgi:hypothetical protein
MHELLTDAEKEKMTAAGEEFYTEYFAEGENDGDFHAETGALKPPLALRPPTLRAHLLSSPCVRIG